MGRKVEQGKLAFGRLERGAAFFADGPDQPLGQHRHQRRGNQERFNPHVNQTGDRAGRVIGVEGAQDEMPGERGLNGDLRCFQVAHFPQHDDIGVLAEKGAEGLAEGHADGVIDRDLHDALDVVFDGVFNSEQFGVDAVDAGEAGIKRGRFAGAGGAGDDENSVGLLNGLDHVVINHFWETNGLDVQLDRRAIQHAQHH